MKKEGPKSPLIALNDLTLLNGGVFVRRGVEVEGVAYSDGKVEEEYIYRAVASASDRSSLSEELYGFDRDWASECHLSSKRANVFRAMDFSAVNRVLEIGSGCGAITRFLGEQGGTVDAVEGSLRRAEITRLRCGELDNVTVIYEDFNGLEMPRGHYDLALLTGVLEYAGKYSQKGESPVDAAVAMLTRLMDCLKPGGALVVAIENRIGFKYLAGASEDHFSRPWVGLSGYPDCNEPGYRDKKGIRTWDKRQWTAMLERLPAVAGKWYYPFPDYKLATTLLSEDFIRSSPNAWACLSRVHSRDYTALWHPQIEEQLFWQTAAAANALEGLANSFVLVLQHQGTSGAATNLVPFDFAHFSGHNRKSEYRIMVRKKSGENKVEKTPLSQLSTTEDKAVVVQHLGEEPYFEGKPLSVHWTEVLRSCPSPHAVFRFLREYYQYLVDECQQHGAEGLLDLLPFNIIVAEDGSWHSFDQEWQAREAISPQFIFFRAVLYFYVENRAVLQSFCRKQQLQSGWDYITYCLGRVLYSGEYDLEKFIDLENRIQQTVTRSESFTPIEQILDSSPEPAAPTWSWENTSLIWGENAVSSPPVSSANISRGQQRIVYHLPPEALLSTYVQLSLDIPQQGLDSVFKVHSLALWGILPTGERQKIIPAEPDQNLPQLIKLTGLSFFPGNLGGVYVVDEEQSQILHFYLPGQTVPHALTALECEVVLEFFGGSGTQIRATHYVEEKKTLEALLEEKRHQLAQKRHQLAQIENSRGWRTVVGLRRIKEKVTALFGLRPEHSAPVEGGAETGTAGRRAFAAKGKAGVGDEKLFTVLLATHNTGTSELLQTIHSVLDQSYPNWELIIVDSASTRGATLQGLAGLRHPRIKIHCLKQSENLTEALNEGISLACGEWVAFLGHFDRFSPAALLTVAETIKSENADVLYTDEEVIDRLGTPLKRLHKPDFNRDSLDGSDIIGSSLFIRRSLIDQAGGLDPEYDGVQLFDLVLRAAKFSDKMVHLKEALYKVRQFEPPSQEELDRKLSGSTKSWQENLGT